MAFGNWLKSEGLCAPGDLKVVFQAMLENATRICEAKLIPLFTEIMSRQLAKLLRGSKPADLPVEQPTKFELVINPLLEADRRLQGQIAQLQRELEPARRAFERAMELEVVADERASLSETSVQHFPFPIPVRKWGAVSPYARVSWVHVFKPNRAINASFIALPGAGFSVDGPRAASDAARIDAGTKLAITPTAWLSASFDGEFSSRSQSYAALSPFSNMCATTPKLCARSSLAIVADHWP